MTPMDWAIKAAPFEWEQHEKIAETIREAIAAERERCARIAESEYFRPASCIADAIRQTQEGE